MKSYKILLSSFLFFSCIFTQNKALNSGFFRGALWGIASGCASLYCKENNVFKPMHPFIYIAAPFIWGTILNSYFENKDYWQNFTKNDDWIPKNYVTYSAAFGISLALGINYL